jgi:uncharacterized membrane protein
MILYNTIVGLAAGVALVLVAALFKKLVHGERVQPEGFALVFGMTGFILTVLGLAISVTWPYKKVLHANIMLGEPALAFGVTARSGCNLFMEQARAISPSGRAR